MNFMKGSVLDVLFIFTIIFVTAVVAIFGTLVVTEMNTRLQTIDSIPAVAKNAAQGGVDFFVYWDPIIMIFLGGLMVATLVAATQLNAHPVFFVGAFMFLIVTVLVGAQFSNMFLEFANNSAITSASIQFPLVVQFFQNGPLFLAGFTFLLLVVMFAFGRQNAF